MVLVTMCELDGDVSRAVLLPPQVELQVPFDFAQGRLSASSGFPVRLSGFGGFHAAFLKESRIRGRW